MIYQNIEVYNVSELVPHPEGGVSWIRLPRSIDNIFDAATKKQNDNCTGVELRFVVESGKVNITLARLDPDYNTRNVFTVYRGCFQGTWQDNWINTNIGPEPKTFTFEKTYTEKELSVASDKIHAAFSPDVVRIIFDAGHYRIVSVEGDVRPPKPGECPEMKILFYGSSITHGGNALHQSNSYPYITGRAFGCDVRNYGLSGTCRLQPEIADFIADEGQKGRWDTAVFELGMNVLEWEREKTYSAVGYLVGTVAKANPDKHLFAISPTYCRPDLLGEPRAAVWREEMEKAIAALALPNVTYINGTDLLGDVSLLCADMVHPSPDGAAAIARGLIEVMRPYMK